MYARATLCVILLAAVVGVMGEDPTTVTVGHRDGGFVGFQSVQGTQFFVASTPTGGLVINSSPKDTIVEWTRAKSPAHTGTYSFAAHLLALTD